MPTMFRLENWEERIRLEYLGVDTRIILEKQNGFGLNLCGRGWRPVAGTCEHVNETSASIQCRDIYTSLESIGFSKRGLLREVCSK